MNIEASEKFPEYSTPQIKYKLKHPEAFAEIITSNIKMLTIFHYIESIAPSMQLVLITGETGVGKELIARSIHKCSNLSGPMITVNVAGLDDNMFSDTLFGHTKGAFSGAERVRRGLIERAEGGTLFLDEIGNLSHASQVKLLRLLEGGEYLPLGQDEVKHAKVRIVSATNEDLWNLQRLGKYRKDLNFRLRTHHMNIPSLRERKDDIPLLVDHFLGKIATILKKKKPTPPKELFTLLKNYSFPGNIRELEAMIFDTVYIHKAKILSLNKFKSHIEQERSRTKNLSEPEQDERVLVKFPQKLPTIKEATQLLVDETMKRADENMTIAAKILGISRQALGKRLKNKDSS